MVAFTLGCRLMYTRPTDDTLVAEGDGRDLVVRRANCVACHDPAEEAAEKPLSGGKVLQDSREGFTINVPNITPDEETGIGAWTDDQIMRAIRDGVRHDGEMLSPVHPYESYRYMSDEDVSALVVYLRYLPKVKRPRQENKIPWQMKLALSTGATMHEPAMNVKAPDPSKPVEFGKYLAYLGNCWGCHSRGISRQLTERDRDYMGGSKVPFADPLVGEVWASNLTPHKKTGLGSYTDEQILKAFFAATRLDGEPMVTSMEAFHKYQGDLEDGKALVAFLRSLTPVEHQVPPRKLKPQEQKRLSERRQPAMSSRSR
jgi:mono/diheme cytochrome c family protein